MEIDPIESQTVGLPGILRAWKRLVRLVQGPATVRYRERDGFVPVLKTMATTVVVAVVVHGLEEVDMVYT